MFRCILTINGLQFKPKFTSYVKGFTRRVHGTRHTWVIWILPTWGERVWCDTHTRAPQCRNQESRATIAQDIIFYLLLILFTQRCQFEWQLAEHFRVCLPASSRSCQGLTGIHSLCRRKAAPRWLAAVCLFRKCSASAGQRGKREKRRKGGCAFVWGVLMDLSQPASGGFYTISSQKMEMSWLGTSPQQLESGPVVYLIHSQPSEY